MSLCSSLLQECLLNTRLIHSGEHTVTVPALSDLGPVCPSIPIAVLLLPAALSINTQHLPIRNGALPPAKDSLSWALSSKQIWEGTGQPLLSSWLT